MPDLSGRYPQAGSFLRITTGYERGVQKVLLRGFPGDMHATAWLKSLVHTSQPNHVGASKASMRTTVTGSDLPDRQSVEQGKEERESC